MKTKILKMQKTQPMSLAKKQSRSKSSLYDNQLFNDFLRVQSRKTAILRGKVTSQQNSIDSVHPLTENAHNKYRI